MVRPNESLARAHVCIVVGCVWSMFCSCSKAGFVACFFLYFGIRVDEWVIGWLGDWVIGWIDGWKNGCRYRTAGESLRCIGYVRLIRYSVLYRYSMVSLQLLEWSRRQSRFVIRIFEPLFFFLHFPCAFDIDWFNPFVSYLTRLVIRHHPNHHSMSCLLAYNHITARLRRKTDGGWVGGQNQPQTHRLFGWMKCVPGTLSSSARAGNA